tara:strand:- start:441 stop:722 length:282 start_codon:yes stop_codon:yes gene_type:complete
MSAPVASVIEARLRDGYGADDITVLDGIAGPFVRGHIARLRQNGKLQEILGAPSRVGESGVASSLVDTAPVSARPPDAPASAVTHRTDAGGQE